MAKFKYTKRMTSLIEAADQKVLEILQNQTKYGGNDRTIRACLEYVQHFADRDIMVHALEHMALSDDTKGDFLDIIVEHEAMDQDSSIRKALPFNETE